MKNRVLICDDAAIMRLAIKDVLTRNGYEIVGEACNGREAVMLYDSLKPDLVFMDITMPEQDGVSALKEIKKPIRLRVSLCALQWDSHPLLRRRYRQGRRILLSSRFRVQDCLRRQNKH